MTESSLNAQIVDSVAVLDFLNIAGSPASSQAMLDAVMSETLGMAMHNAVMRQQANSLVSSAATTAACARMLQVPGNDSVPPPPPPVKPVIPPLDGSVMPPGEAAISRAAAKADDAIRTLEEQASSSRQEAGHARSALSHLASTIGAMMGRTPAPPPPPAPPAPVHTNN